MKLLLAIISLVCFYSHSANGAQRIDESLDVVVEKQLDSNSLDDAFASSSVDCTIGKYPHYSPCIRLYADALFLHRDNNSINQPVAINNATDAVLLNTQQLEFNMEPGLRTGVIWRHDECSSFEVSYFGLHEWHESHLVTGNDNLAIPGDQGIASLDFFDADSMLVDYSSEIHNAEVNYGVLHDETTKFLIGLRYFGLSENFNINTTDLDTGTSDYRINTANRLLGPQAGLIFGIPFRNTLFEISGKIGVMANSAQQRTFLGDFDNSFVFRNSETHRRRASVLGELGFNFSHQFSRHWFGRLGYNLIFVEGLALAPDQLDYSLTATSGLTLHDDGGLFLHGFNVGLTAAW